MQQRLLCLWLLLTCVCITFGLSLGLTWRSDHFCYAGVCGSWLFPRHARLHVGLWYLWLLLSVLFLTLRATQPSVRRLTSSTLGLTIPLLEVQVTLGGLILVLWQALLYSALLGVWWPKLEDYFAKRGAGLPGNLAIAFVAQSGHLADVTMGMVLLPITRYVESDWIRAARLNCRVVTTFRSKINSDILVDMEP